MLQAPLPVVPENQVAHQGAHEEGNRERDQHRVEGVAGDLGGGPRVLGTHGSLSPCDPRAGRISSAPAACRNASEDRGDAAGRFRRFDRCGTFEPPPERRPLPLAWRRLQYNDEMVRAPPRFPSVTPRRISGSHVLDRRRRLFVRREARRGAGVSRATTTSTSSGSARTIRRERAARSRRSRGP